MTTTKVMRMAQKVAAELAIRADEADKQGKMPAQDLQALRQSGYLTLSIPVEYGGYGLSLADCVAAQIELAQGSGSTALVAAMQLQVFGNARELRSWTEPVFAELCRLAVQEGALFNSVASEPEMGSPSRGGVFKTEAIWQAEEWQINGHKTWITGGRHLTHLLVKLTVEGGSGVVLIPQTASGLEWVESWGDALSFRASESHDLYLRQVKVPAQNLIERSSGDKRPNIWFPLMISATYMGVALAARQAVIQFALERTPAALGKPIATLPKIQRQIGEMEIALQSALSLLFDVARAWSGKDEDRPQIMARIAAAKHLVNETANRVTDKALQIAGGASITRALPLERYFRDVRAGSMQPPSGDTALEMVGQAAIEHHIHNKVPG